MSSKNKILISSNYELISKQINRLIGNSRESFEEIFIEMMDHENNKYSKNAWKPILNSKLAMSDFAPLEESLGHDLPEVYKEWLLYAHAYPMRLHSFFLYGNQPLKQVGRIQQEQNFVQNHPDIFTIGYDTWSMFRLVFDFSDPAPNNDIPLKMFVPEGGIMKSELKKDVVFSSFSKLLECWNYSLGEGKRMGIEAVMKKIIEIDPTTKDFWEMEIENAQLWDDMDP